MQEKLCFLEREFASRNRNGPTVVVGGSIARHGAIQRHAEQRHVGGSSHEQLVGATAVQATIAGQGIGKAPESKGFSRNVNGSRNVDVYILKKRVKKSATQKQCRRICERSIDRGTRADALASNRL